MMPSEWPDALLARRAFVVLGAAAAMFLAGCATKAPSAAVLTQELAFQQAIESATDALVAQTQKLPGFLAVVEAKIDAKLNKRGVVFDPSLDAGSGQQTTATQQLDKLVGDRLSSAFEQFEVLPFRAANLTQAQYLLTGTMTRVRGDQTKSPYRIDLALVDLKTGLVAAQASSIARADGVDMSPLAYYRDSPVLVKDKVIEGYVRTAASAPGERADATYIERVSTAATINDANVLYNNARYQEALGQYRSALATPAGEQIRVLNGIYLTNVKLGRMAEAEQAFGRVVKLGIAYNELGVKFLFNPGGTEFWSDQKVSGAYGMWLRQIAKESAAAKVCMDIVGHTSKTGSGAANDALSLRRATLIQQRLAGEGAEAAARTKPVGMGFKENIVGSGTDDGVDALDRRVEFRIVPCS
jgi:outer membrane protein OmpA-like peptidoglycan-associated protein